MRNQIITGYITILSTLSTFSCLDLSNKNQMRRTLQTTKVNASTICNDTVALYTNYNCSITETNKDGTGSLQYFVNSSSTKPIITYSSNHSQDVDESDLIFQNQTTTITVSSADLGSQNITNTTNYFVNETFNLNVTNCITTPNLTLSPQIVCIITSIINKNFSQQFSQPNTTSYQTFVKNSTFNVINNTVTTSPSINFTAFTTYQTICNQGSLSRNNVCISTNYTMNSTTNVTNSTLTIDPISGINTTIYYTFVAFCQQANLSSANICSNKVYFLNSSTVQNQTFCYPLIDTFNQTNTTVCSYNLITCNSSIPSVINSNLPPANPIPLMVMDQVTNLTNQYNFTNTTMCTAGNATILNTTLNFYQSSVLNMVNNLSQTSFNMTNFTSNTSSNNTNDYTNNNITNNTSNTTVNNTTSNTTNNITNNTTSTTVDNTDNTNNTTVENTTNNTINNIQTNNISTNNFSNITSNNFAILQMVNIGSHCQMFQARVINATQQKNIDCQNDAEILQCMKSSYQLFVQNSGVKRWCGNCTDAGVKVQTLLRTRNAACAKNFQGSQKACNKAYVKYNSGVRVLKDLCSTK